MDYKALGKRIRAQRKLLGISQDELAAMAGISYSFIGLIERGDRKLSLETLVKISEALNISCDTLLQDSLKVSRSVEITGMNERSRKLLNEIADVLRENVSQEL